MTGGAEHDARELAAPTVGLAIGGSKTGIANYPSYAYMGAQARAPITQIETNRAKIVRQLGEEGWRLGDAQ